MTVAVAGSKCLLRSEPDPTSAHRSHRPGDFCGGQDNQSSLEVLVVAAILVALVRPLHVSHLSTSGRLVANRVPIRASCERKTPADLKYSRAVPESTPANAIAFRDVNFSRGSLVVLRGFSLQIAAGDTLALVGRSGAGKSTILKLINRLLVPDAGDVLVESRSTREWDPFQLRRRAGYVMQEVGLFPHLSVAENIAIVPRLLGWDDRKIASQSGRVARVGGTRH